MILTPTNAGGLGAGAVTGVFTWSVALKGTKVPLLKRFYTEDRKEKLLDKMNRNKGVSLLLLEAANFAIHGFTDAKGVFFAFGNTIVNSVMIFGFLPLRQRAKGKAKMKAVLQGVKTA